VLYLGSFSDTGEDDNKMVLPEQPQFTMFAMEYEHSREMADALSLTTLVNWII